MAGAGIADHLTDLILRSGHVQTLMVQIKGDLVDRMHRGVLSRSLTPLADLIGDMAVTASTLQYAGGRWMEHPLPAAPTVVC